MIEQLLKMLSDCGIEIHPSDHKSIISLSQDEIFPVAIGDDGGWVSFSCEVPITREGDLIQEGVRYDTSYENNVLVTKMELKQGLCSFWWIITVLDSEGCQEELMVYEFKRISF